MLVKKESTLEYLGYVVDKEGNETALYGYTDEDTDEDVPCLAIRMSDYKDFGSPEKVTVVITPGDSLN